MIKVAIVGSGPAGFYAADALLKSEDPVVEVDLIDRLPTPWGLVRLGVAPDHENIKAVSRAFEKTAAKPGFRFFGNVEIGRDVSHDELLELAGADVIVDPADLELDPASERELEADRERARRNVELLREYAARPPAGKPRRIVLRFLESPVEIVGDERVESIRVVRNELVERN